MRLVTFSQMYFQLSRVDDKLKTWHLQSCKNGAMKASSIMQAPPLAPMIHVAALRHESSKGWTAVFLI